jgi:hypothetical protein
MENCTHLPESYREIMHIDLQKNKKLAILVNAAACIIMVVMLIPIIMINSFSAIAEVVLSPSMRFMLKVVLMVPAMILYMVLHELTHGIFMRKYSGVKPKYGFTGLYAFAGSTAYFNKKSYIIISLAPIVILGMVLAILQFTIPFEWFWFVYILQIVNISGAAGDIYVTYKMSKVPEDILVQDAGVSMTIYSQQS